MGETKKNFDPPMRLPGASENARKVRIAALESRLLMEAPGAESQLNDLLFAAGDGGADLLTWFDAHFPPGKTIGAAPM